MFLDWILSELIIALIVGCAGTIFIYLRRKFKCQNTIQTQLDNLDKKFNALIKIHMLLLEKTHPELVKEYEKLIDIGTK